ncbi:hypothetical protein ACHQM5_018897 [Ranunculus cassubicifolius]
MDDPPQFKGDYFYWKLRMRAHLQYLGADVWFTVVHGYTAPTLNDQPKPYSLWSEAEEKKFNSNGRGLNAIFVAIPDDTFWRIALCTTSKEAWDNLESFYEGGEDLKISTLDVLASKFSEMRMRENEKFDKFYLRLLDVVNRGKALGGPYDDQRVGYKILNSLPKRFEVLRYILQEKFFGKRMTLDAVIDRLRAYDMDNWTSYGSNEKLNVSMLSSHR